MEAQEVEGRIAQIKDMFRGTGKNVVLIITGEEEPLEVGCFDPKMIEGLKPDMTIKAKIEQVIKGNKVYYNFLEKPVVLSVPTKQETLEKEAWKNTDILPKTEFKMSAEKINAWALQIAVDYNKGFNQDPSKPDQQAILNKVFEDAKLMAEFIDNRVNPFKEVGK